MSTAHDRVRRVLMTAEVGGGIWTYAMELSRELGRQGVEVGLAVQGELGREERAVVRRAGGIEVFEGGFSGGRLAELEEKFSPDVVHVNHLEAGGAPSGKPRLVVGHACALSRWKATRGGEPMEPWPGYREAVAKAVRSADCVVAPSQAMLFALICFYGPVRSGRVILHGRDPELFKPVEKRPYVFSAGRAGDEAKNLAVLEAAAARMPWKVYVAGLDKGAGPLVGLGSLSRVQLARWAGGASVFAAPARYEPFGLTILEAALAGCALVLGDIPSLRELWVGAAVFVAPDDPDALREALLRWVRNPDQRREWGALAQCRGIQFSPQEMGANYLQVYQELKAGRPCGEAATPAGGEGR